MGGLLRTVSFVYIVLSIIELSPSTPLTSKQVIESLTALPPLTRALEDAYQHAPSLTTGTVSHVVAGTLHAWLQYLMKEYITRGCVQYLGPRMPYYPRIPTALASLIHECISVPLLDWATCWYYFPTHAARTVREGRVLPHSQDLQKIPRWHSLTHRILFWGRSPFVCLKQLICGLDTTPPSLDVVRSSWAIPHHLMSGYKKPLALVCGLASMYLWYTSE